ncbi:helix-turn-helix transcriptional regulator [Bifidobacterium simiarum]|uniref:XRE family transcriptional regulator n=1 Tax=Bifidobacterium simiarum TaxID=2045441 RepID=A0A2M9HE90_9BIFI|nr:XRE family transcriptional regulator [Bifidobacterium simiarum]
MGLREIRKRRGITQAMLAELSGIPRPNISDIETGKKPAEQLWLVTALKLADTLDCDPHELLH